MNEKQEAIRRQLEKLRAESDALKVEERTAHRHLAQIHKELEPAMKAYHAILARQSQVEKEIKRLLAKDSRIKHQSRMRSSALTQSALVP